ncbi:hypothetical protein VSF3289_04115 [Vibrio scophthalmi]|uniref:Uncharacterized protein n=1 Tax=Vibrio scophthalmi TaxID=45658 RepID=A0A1E3WGP1_9VIBR|nr:hypothetical protein VSF3289_04115 [Vibrio scophthalmi]
MDIALTPAFHAKCITNIIDFLSLHFGFTALPHKLNLVVILLAIHNEFVPNTQHYRYH